MNKFGAAIEKINTSPDALKTICLALYEEACIELQEANKVRGVSRVIPREAIISRIEEKMNNEFKEYGFPSFNAEKVGAIKDSLYKWDPELSSPEETEKIGMMQGLLLHIVIEQQKRQEEMHSSLLRLKEKIAQGKEILEEKLTELQGRQGQNTAGKITMLQEAIGNAEPPWYKNDIPSFNGLTAQLEYLTKSKEAITALEINALSTQFDELINNKLVAPLKEYENEKGGWQKLKDWISDVVKELTGLGTLSTGGTVQKVVANQSAVFKEEINKMKANFPQAEGENVIVLGTSKRM
ncbi:MULTISPECIES: hypothetical protein [Legionella]|uniref:hypothetical protein n=1 Tax=Legionella TaxID=445 RepID=UPI000F8DFEA3|nr:MULTISPECIES: hypothetical protein [Legionella]MCP0914282.1 hypothetical protein [Legionella sp. 27cVA30]RUR00613.1 hypothetical protein ELY11_02355 [Legionella septentrionalis]